MRALIVALNPAVDAEWRVDDVLWEEKNNIRSERRWPGGKGINVARWLKHLGGKPHLILPLGGTTGREIAAGLRAEKLVAKIIPLREPTRVNVVVTSARGGQIRFNPLGPKLSRAEWSAVLKTVEQQLYERPTPGPSQEGNYTSARRMKLPSFGGVGGGFGKWKSGVAPLLILSGSLPRGVPVSAYAQILRVARRRGVRTLLDCDGRAFVVGLKARPFLVKPNEHELAQWRGKTLKNEKEIINAARALSETTGGWVLVSRGAKRSLLMNARENHICFAAPPRVRVRNTVGAGDAMLAAVALGIAHGRSPEEWLQCGVSTGATATLLAPGKSPAAATK